MLRNVIFVIPLILFLAGCQTVPRHVPLDSKKAASIKLVHVVSMVVQDEIIARSKPSYVTVALGGGLLGAAIDSSITESRMREIYAVLEPAYESFDDVDLREIFWPQLRDFLNHRARLNISNIKTTPRLITDSERHELMANMKEDTYLETYTRYSFDPDLRTFNIITGTYMASKNQEQAAYRNTITYQSPIVGNGMQHSMDLWTENNGERFRQAMAEGISETIRQIEIDLGRETISPSKQTMTLTYNTGTDIIGRTGKVMIANDKRIILREKDGTLVSLENKPFKAPEPVEF